VANYSTGYLVFEPYPFEEYRLNQEEMTHQAWVDLMEFSYSLHLLKIYQPDCCSRLWRTLAT